LPQIKRHASPSLEHDYKAWLRSHGAELLSTTNPWELVRFRTGRKSHILYQNVTGLCHHSSPEAERIFLSFATGENPNIHFKVRRKNSTLTKDLLKEVLSRDGAKCIYCHIPFSTKNPPTLEHFLPLVHGGNNKLANLGAACHSCNTKVGNLSIAEKFNLAKGPPHD
jgi:hypothetical protein